MEIDTANIENSIEGILKPVLVLNRDLTILRMNGKALDLLGNADLCGRKCHEVVRRSATPCEYCQIALSFRTGVPHTEEGCLVEFGPVKIALRLAALLGAEGAPDLAVLVAEPALPPEAGKLASDKFRSIVEHSPLWILETDATGGIQYFNRRAEEQSGYSLEEIRGRNVLEFIPETHREEQMMMLMRGLQGLHNPIRTPIRMKDGAIRTFLNNSSVIMEPEGPRMLVFAIDVTQWAEAEEALKKQMAMEKTASLMSQQLAGEPDRNKAFLAALETLCVAAGCSRAYIYLNDEELRTITKAHEFARHDCPSVVPAGWTMEIKDFPAWKEILLAGNPVTIRDAAQLPPGSAYREVLDKDGVKSALLVPMKFHNENIGFIGLDDIQGPRAWSETEIGLVRLVAEIVTAFILRTRSEENDRISREAAEAADRAKSVFLASMSHEIRTPLTGILGMIELALETVLTAEQRDYLTLARSSASTLLGLLGSILDLAKIEAGKFDLEKKPFDVRSAVEDTAANLSLKAQEAGLEVLVAVDPLIPSPLRGDENRVRQILSNLMDNAVKYCPAGEITVSARLESREPGVHRVAFEIADTGPGISQEQQEAIFEPFTRGLEASGGGVGLGLTISRQLSLAMGGAIRVESEPGKGSKFTLSLPLQDDSTTAKETPEFLLEGRTALIVSPRPGLRSSLAALLGFFGLAVSEAGGLGESIELVRELRAAGKLPDLVFLDATAGGEAASLVAGLKERGVPPSSMVVLIPGAGGKEADTREWASRGVNLKLLKPPRRASVEKLLARFFEEPTPEKPTRIMVRESVKGPPRILLAEDNLVNRKLISSLLVKRGFEPVEAVDGREALKLFNEGAFAAVLMDIQMPGMDGLAATLAIRKAEATLGGHVPIIAMTAHAMIGDREKCLAAGMDDYVSKPLRFNDLIKTLVRWTQGESETWDEKEGEETAGEPPLNFEDIRNRLGMEPREMLGMIDLLLADAPAHVEAMKQAAARGNRPELASAAHRIKGSSGNLGAQELFNRSRELEMAARSEGPVDAVAMIGSVERALARLAEYVSMMKKSMK